VVTQPGNQGLSIIAPPRTDLPPGEMTGSIEQFDARPGGSYRMVLTYRDTPGSPGKSTPDSDLVEGRFIEPVPGVRVV
jgi:hypothetical protein